MTKSEIMQALKLTNGKFDTTLGRQLKWKFIGSRKKFFLTEDKMPEDVRNLYVGFLVCEADDDSKQVEEILGDVTEGINALPNELDAARLDNLKMRTAVLGQKLDEQKQSIWYEWNQAVFEEFSEAFAKVKNDLINLHLDEKQIESLNSSIDAALKNLEDRLETLWNKFKNGEDEMN